MFDEKNWFLTSSFSYRRMFDKGMRGVYYIYTTFQYMKTVKLAIVDDNVNDVSRLKSLIEKAKYGAIGLPQLLKEAILEGETYE